MASHFRIHGPIAPSGAQRVAEQRSEDRTKIGSQAAVLEFRGRKHVVRLADISPSGAMLMFSLIPNIGEPISIQLIGRGRIGGHVCWAKDGKIGVTFVAPLE